MTMQFRVLRDHIAYGKQLTRGEVVELENSDRVMQMVEQRWLLPLETAKMPSVPSVSEVVRKTRAPRAVGA